jgi:hypothetical protein
MRGLDPRIHLLRKKFSRRGMDCRVKPGNDGVDAGARNSIPRHYNRHACRSNRPFFPLLFYNEFRNSHVSAAYSPQIPFTAMWSNRPHAAASGVG